MAPQYLGYLLYIKIFVTWASEGKNDGLLLAYIVKSEIILLTVNWYDYCKDLTNMGLKVACPEK